MRRYGAHTTTAILPPAHGRADLRKVAVGREKPSHLQLVSFGLVPGVLRRADLCEGSLHRMLRPPPLVGSRFECGDNARPHDVVERC